MTKAVPILSIRDLSVTFSTGSGEVQAIKSLNMDVLPGQTLAIVGESGSGKSTLASSICGLLPANARLTAGGILFCGKDLAIATDREMQSIRGARIGLIPQDPMSNLDPVFRVGDQITEALEVHGLASGAKASQRAIDLLTMVGIPDARNRLRQFPHEFSGGMRQRVLVAIGLACRPPLVIADEPTSALDVTVQRRILDRLGELTAQIGSALILITHDLALAAERADEVLVMYRGDLVEQGSASRILRSPEHPYTRELISAVPSLQSTSFVGDRPMKTRDTDGSADKEYPLLWVERLTKQFPLPTRGLAAPVMFTAVDDVNLSIPRGKTVAVVGESGSGKSTIAKLILGIEEPTGGDIRFSGTDIAALNRKERLAFRRDVQPVFQNPYSSLDPRFTVARSISEPLNVHGTDTVSARRRRVLQLLDQVALPQHVSSRFPHELSGGQRQRVAIARALALSPQLVILDEAVSALDVLVQAQILELLIELQRELGLSYLFISHDLAVVRLISHSVHVMQHGRIIESGTPSTIFSHPREGYTRELLAAIPSPAA